METVHCKQNAVRSFVTYYKDLLLDNTDLKYGNQQ
jgi:hypothetical protein